MSDTEIREAVRERYAKAGEEAGAGSDCCGEATVLGVDEIRFGGKLYDESARKDLPDSAVLASLGCGNPTAVAELHEGETVLDLGSGGGIDVFLSAKRVGPTGKVYGLDMTDEMLELARRNQREAGVVNVEFVRGYIEDIPLPDRSVDVVISNCVINLSADKARVFAEMFRVIRPGGRIGVSDIVAANDLTPEERSEQGSYVNCIAGALSFAEYEAGLRSTGFAELDITATHEVEDGMFATIVKATKPVDRG